MSTLSSFLPKDSKLVVVCSTHKRSRELGLDPCKRGLILSSSLSFPFYPLVRKDQGFQVTCSLHLPLNSPELSLSSIPISPETLLLSRVCYSFNLAKSSLPLARFSAALNQGSLLGPAH